jgi:hypothetical protein
MAIENLIAANDFCVYHHVEYTFLDSLEEAGLVELTIIDQQKYIPHEQLQRTERMARLHYELEINLAGIASIMNMLERIELMQGEIKQLKNKLRFFEH